MSLLETQHAIERARDQALASRGLPEIAFVDNSHDKSAGAPSVIGIRRGESGYHPVFTRFSADELNARNGVTAAQRVAMHNGSLFGWETPGADPTHPVVLQLVGDTASS